jgi:hypothetical protein
MEEVYFLNEQQTDRFQEKFLENVDESTKKSNKQL